MGFSSQVNLVTKKSLEGIGNTYLVDYSVAFDVSFML